MAFRTSYNSALGMALALVVGEPDTENTIGIGTIIKAYDPLLGEGEFIYLPGVADTVAGDMVTYDLNPAGPVTARAGTGDANSGAPVAFASAAIGAGQFGWYQIGGVAVANVAAGFAAGGSVFATANAGIVDDAAVAGAQVLGAIGSSAIGTPAAGKAYLTISRPFLQGQIT